MPRKTVAVHDSDANTESMVPLISPFVVRAETAPCVRHFQPPNHHHHQHTSLQRTASAVLLAPEQSPGSPEMSNYGVERHPEPFEAMNLCGRIEDLLRRIFSKWWISKSSVPVRSASQDDVSQLIDSEPVDDVEPIEVENWMRRRLCYFFMTPIEKYQAKHRIPFKFFLQILKIIFLTIQLIFFSFSRSSHVSFSEASEDAFSHLYLQNWDPQYETLPYPPASGQYAVYSRDDFYATIGYALKQYYSTEDIGVGGYSFPANPSIQLCLTSTDKTKCIEVDRYALDIDKLSDPDKVEEYLRHLGIRVDFDDFLSLTIRFDLLSTVVYGLDWATQGECFKYHVKITFTNIHQSGKIGIRLRVTFKVLNCMLLPDHNKNASIEKPIEIVHEAWKSSGGIRLVKITKVQILLIFINLFTALLATVSLLLCARSLYFGFRMWMEAVGFFKHWFKLDLKCTLLNFVQLWYLLTIFVDILIIIGSLYQVASFFLIEKAYDAVSCLHGIAILLVWAGILRYVGFSYANSLLIRTMAHSIPGLLRFCICALILFLGFALCGWAVLGPYNMKFRTFTSTLECLFSLLNGDDMYVTFSIIDEDHPMGVFFFSRCFLYLFIVVFIYIVLNLFLTIIFEAYEQVKELQASGGRPLTCALWKFLCQASHSPKSPLFKLDDQRRDRHLLFQYAQGIKLFSFDDPSPPVTDNAGSTANHRIHFAFPTPSSTRHESQSSGTYSSNTVGGPAVVYPVTDLSASSTPLPPDIFSTPIDDVVGAGGDEIIVNASPPTLDHGTSEENASETTDSSIRSRVSDHTDDVGSILAPEDNDNNLSSL